MKYKNYKDEIKEGNFGVIIEGEKAGKPSYIEHPEIKEVEIDGKFVPNEGYNLASIKNQIVDSIKNDDKFRIDLIIFGVIDQMIANESNAKIKAVYNALKADAVARLIEYKQKIIDNS